MKQNKVINSLLFTNLFSALAFAQEAPRRFSDWTFVKKIPNGESSTRCIAYTEKKVNEVLWSFSVEADPTRATAPTILVASAESTISSPLSVQGDSRSTQFIFLRSQQADSRFGAPAYWYAPNAFSDFYKQVRRDSALKVNFTDATGKAQKMYFSLSGSMAALNELQKKCADGGVEVIQLPFFEALQKAQAVPEPSAETGAVPLQRILQGAWITYFSTGSLSAALKKIEADMKPLMAQQTSYLRRAGLLTQDIEEKTKAKTEAESRQSALRRSKAEFEASLAATESELVPALALAKEKEEVYRVAFDEAKPFFAAAESASSYVRSYRSEISSQESRVSNAESNLRSLQSELSNIESKKRDTERKLNSRESDRSTAQSRLNAFNYDFEYRQALASDWRHRSLRTDIEKTQNELDEFRRKLGATQSRLRSVQSELRGCQSQSERDCTSLQRELSSLESEERSVQSSISSSSSRLSDYRRDLERRETEIAATVNQEREKLANEVYKIDRELASLRSDLSALQSDLENIRNYRIPSEESNARDARAQLASLRPALQRAIRDYEERDAALQSVLSRTQYHAKKQAFEAAQSRVSSLRAQAEALDANIKRAASEIAKLVQFIARTQTEIDTLVSNLASNRQELAAIEAVLEPLRVEKNRLTEELTTAQEQLRVAFSAFKALYRDSTTQTQQTTEKFYEWR